MREKYYIADLHIGHGKLNEKMDERGFKSVEEMNDHIIRQWNSVVHTGDEVYILGDFIWRYDKDKLPELFNTLHGKKFLIIGNHDHKWLNDFNNEKHTAFRWIKDYAEIKDNGRRVILSHYPILTYNHQFSDNAWMLHGHIHWTKDALLIEHYKDICKNDVRTDHHGEESPNANIINCFCMASDYKPLTLDQWIEKEMSGELRRDVVLKWGKW